MDPATVIRELGGGAAAILVALLILAVGGPEAVTHVRVWRAMQ